MADTTVITASADTGTGPAPVRGDRGLRWLPGIVLLAAAVWLFTYYGVGAGDLVRFTAYLLLAIVVPGTLVWRMSGYGSGVLIEEAVVGAVIGYCLQIFGYLAGRAIGVPNLSLLPPAIILILFVAVPTLRRHWRGGGVRVPVWWAWLMTTFVLAVFVWSGYAFFRLNGLVWPKNSTPYVDMPFHLALAGELKNHVPPHIPYVVGQPLDYHWFVYANLAGTSWATGIELQTLLYRLALVPMLLVLFVGIAATTRRLTGRWWPGAFVALLCMFYAPPNPYGWTVPLPTTGVSLDTWYASPTQTFGSAIFAGFTVLLVDLIRRPVDRRAPRPWGWVIATLMILTVAGAKATYLPLMLCGLLLAVVWDLVFNRRLNRPAAALFGITAITFVAAERILYGGDTGGVAFDPWWLVIHGSNLITRTGLLFAGHHTDALIAAVVLVLVLWSVGLLAGAGGLALRRTWRDPALAFCLGLGAAGVGAALMYRQSHWSQLYFWWSGTPYLLMLAAAGLSAALPARRLTWRVAGALLGAVVAGTVAVNILVSATGTVPPTHRLNHGLKHTLVVIAGPIAALVAVAMVIAVAVYALQRWRSGRHGVGVALAAAAATLLAAGVMPSAGEFVRASNRTIVAHGWSYLAEYPDQTVPRGGVEAARWLRDHSAPDDLVATNVHCAGSTVSNCDARNFWISAYTERHILVEGWAYTVEANVYYEKVGRDPVDSPFWNQPMLEANDDAFRLPSAHTIATLRDAYGVRWLFVDKRFDPPAPELGRFATLRYSSGDCQVYELPPATG